MTYSFMMPEFRHRAVIDIFNYFVTETHAPLLGDAVAYSFFDQFYEDAPYRQNNSLEQVNI